MEKRTYSITIVNEGAEGVFNEEIGITDAYHNNIADIICKHIDTNEGMHISKLFTEILPHCTNDNEMLYASMSVGKAYAKMHANNENAEFKDAIELMKLLIEHKEDKTTNAKEN